MRLIDQAEVRARLSFEICIPLMRRAMIALSAGDTRQIPRSIIPLPDGLFGVMAGAMGGQAVFGAKLISVFPRAGAMGLQSHQGVVVLFDGRTGAPVCVADAGEITAIRTAAASAVATDALARGDASRLTILGAGEQARAHALALSRVRTLSAITVWGRSADRAATLAAELRARLAIPVHACDSARAAVAEADIICTVTAAAAPILLGAWAPAGAHVNLVGSSHAGPAEVDSDLVASSRFIADSREAVLAQGAEFLVAKAAGRVGDAHIVGEIGRVLTGEVEGRQFDDQITVYKSLGHIVQDLFAAAALLA